MCEMFYLLVGHLLQQRRLFLHNRMSFTSFTELTCDILVGLCGDNCMLCCGDGSRYARFQCMRWANGTKLASAKYCWKVNQFLLHPYDESDSPDWRSSSPLDNTYQSHSFYTDPEEDDDYSTGWRLTIIWAAFVVFMVALTQYRRCVNTQRTSQESEEEEPLAAQIPSHSDPVPVQNARYVTEMRFGDLFLVKVKLWLLLHWMGKSTLD